MTYKKDMVKRSGLMVLHMKGIIRMVLKMVREYLNGQRMNTMKENLLKIELKGMVNIYGQMVVNIKENGLILR